ncbi:hypothetical protein MNV49_007587 [Pseudohyphozyma bogoriensis]|nr:hypothetical protein MNV49_007587 [Pseudohyphozyma bogoriensis]
MSSTQSLPHLTELLLSSTSYANPVPTTSLHAIQTGALVFSLKAPSGANTSSAKAEDGESTLPFRRTLGYVGASGGVGGAVIALGGKEGRSGINVWGFQKEQVLQKFIPPVRLSTIALSNGGLYLAGGTADGRIFLWDLPTGTLLITLDAHYRSVSVLEFTTDDGALISGSEDAGISIWSIGSILASTPMNPPSPFATLTDHTLPISAIAVGTGTFPCCRILTASSDATCKIWDLATSPPSLLSTFSFPAPVTHVAWDPLERFFFAVFASTDKEGSTVTRVDLYERKEDEFGHVTVDAVGGGGRGQVETVDVTGKNYSIPETLSALHLSPHSPTLYIGTTSTQIHILSLPSLLPIRIIPSPLSTTPLGPITFLSSLLRPAELGTPGLPPREIMANGMGRTVVNPVTAREGGKNGRVVKMRVGRSVDVRELFGGAKSAATPTASSFAVSTDAGVSGGEEKEEWRKKAKAMEEENDKLKAQLAKAVALNESMWTKLVESGVAGGKK